MGKPQQRKRSYFDLGIVDATKGRDFRLHPGEPYYKIYRRGYREGIRRIEEPNYIPTFIEGEYDD